MFDVKDTCQVESEFAFTRREPGKLYMSSSYDPVLMTFENERAEHTYCYQLSSFQP